MPSSGRTISCPCPVAAGHNAPARRRVKAARTGAAALQFGLERDSLDRLDQFRQRGVGSAQQTGTWMHEFSQVLVRPPEVKILRLAELSPAARPGDTAARAFLVCIVREAKSGSPARRTEGNVA